ncbi:transposase [Mycobacterium tuberculosis]|nr:transposase [Mycobacterium tuberculosis]
MVLNWEDGLNALVAEGIEAIVFRTLGDQCWLWESLLPDEVRRLPEELARVDALLDDPAFFAPFVPFFDPRGRSARARGRSETALACGAGA